MKRLLWLLLMASSSSMALDCNNATTTLDMNECAAQEQQVVEARLNEVYRNVMKHLEGNEDHYPEVRAKLLEGQRAWIKFREADCEAQYILHQDGTMRNLVHIGCMQSHAEQRIKSLQAFIGSD
ncbi:lysozyme inhibitor LprI family protein [Parathalassolituus penaei]|uniref:Lysozyme inhibitor LprI family protein n=1 Tax=Parathalassolituus penaei TaxID=2997323 RepID=A0A9X3EBI0_9GAMM|nr:lysozyme inhibitor LprI family protein [Parathalassolituus penaei]MCY0963799.1 lysozyme inhibitor LprI family protein [Parathalassolituus penaei]